MMTKNVLHAALPLRACGQISLVLILGLVAGSIVSSSTVARAADEIFPKHQLPAPTKGGMVIGNCDGKTSVEIENTDGKPLPPEKAQGVADQLMKQWQALHPKADWAVAENDTGTTKRSLKVGSSGAGTNDAQAKDPESKVQAKAPGTLEHEKAVTQQEGSYSNFTDADKRMWNDETEKFVHRGDELFHDGSKLGGRTGMACAMCHPNGSNTHPETYPKFQVQLGRVALLRDMINWCLENPIKAKALKDEDPNLRALEAYILAQRKGTALDYGKH